MVSTRFLVHNLAIIEVTVFLVAVGKVAVLEVVDAKVATTSDAVILVASAPLKVVDVKAAPVLEGVDVIVAVLEVVLGKVTSTSVAVVSDTRSKCGQRYRSPPCSILARTRRGKDLREQSLPRHVCSA